MFFNQTRLHEKWSLHTEAQYRSFKYLNRIRYMLRTTIPLNKKVIEKNTLFLSFYDEVFIHFSSLPFDRNRLYAAIGYQAIPKSNVQLGYLAQTVNTTTKHYLQISFFYNLDLRKKVAG
ncbi:MAG: DUF2490 domain-containing protein [Saprospiraceae bacterium]|nr:DUF2490 domain-containing protein [Saprospiraceae bacterium]